MRDSGAKARDSRRRVLDRMAGRTRTGYRFRRAIAKVVRKLRPGRIRRGGGRESLLAARDDRRHRCQCPNGGGWRRATPTSAESRRVVAFARAWLDREAARRYRGEVARPALS